ncbi:MAG TPA: MFS transporter [Tepidisphaeraceae bacterium]|nr:MFS transporter [Tepidisphaeraceae bacterium]
MDIRHKAPRINLLDFTSPQMRAFHMSWFAFLMCFFAWFGIAPLMNQVRTELHLTPAQVGNTIIASVAITVFARLLAGWLCDRIGPRLTYTGLLILGSLPVMGIALVHGYGSFMLMRLAIGVIGASFVITQYHTSIMFAPNIVGTANATSAGWGNMGGGVTQFVMPALFLWFISHGMSRSGSWRASMVAAGVVCLLTGVAYFLFTQDAPDGNFKELRARGQLPQKKQGFAGFTAALRDPRVWVLFVLYGCCFGIELTIDNIAHLYFTDYFHMGLTTAGWTAAIFGLMNLFGRALGGIFGDRIGITRGLRGRAMWLFAVILAEGLFLILFSRMTLIAPMLLALLAFSLCVQMGCGATFSVVPFINKKSLGSVSGVVGAGGNAGAVAAGFLFKGSIAWPTGLLILGIAVTACSFLALAITFSTADESAARQEMEARLAEQRERESEVAVPAMA